MPRGAARSARNVQWVVLPDSLEEFGHVDSSTDAEKRGARLG